jgi:hypothetical protein
MKVKGRKKKEKKKEIKSRPPPVFDGSSAWAEFYCATRFALFETFSGALLGGV